MKLSEKIYYYRKKCGYSQETLAQIIGISRQAVSKWQTGESDPEIGKLKLLAEAFHVTTDCLLSEEDPENNPEKKEEQPDHKRGTEIYLNLPGSIGKFFKKHGWISGLIVLVYGRLAVGMGFLEKMATRRVLGNSFLPEEALTHSRIYMMATAVIAVGAVLIIGGGILAIYLKRPFK